VTVVCPLAESHTSLGLPARQVLQRSLPLLSKRKSLPALIVSALFAPIAVESMGPLNTSVCQLFANLGRKITSTSGDEREGAFGSREFRCWCNATTLSCYMSHCQPLTTCTPCTQFCIVFILKLPHEHIHRGFKNKNNNNYISYGM